MTFPGAIEHRAWEKSTRRRPIDVVAGHRSAGRLLIPCTPRVGSCARRRQTGRRDARRECPSPSARSAGSSPFGRRRSIISRNYVRAATAALIPGRLAERPWLSDPEYSTREVVGAAGATGSTSSKDWWLGRGVGPRRAACRTRPFRRKMRPSGIPSKPPARPPDSAPPCRPSARVAAAAMVVTAAASRCRRGSSISIKVLPARNNYGNPWFRANLDRVPALTRHAKPFAARHHSSPTATRRGDCTTKVQFCAVRRWGTSTIAQRDPARRR